jgi:hypothetical protein
MLIVNAIELKFGWKDEHPQLVRLIQFLPKYTSMSLLYVIEWKISTDTVIFILNKYAWLMGLILFYGKSLYLDNIKCFILIQRK